jgi:UDP-3-O-[3-hydroxymyristoyl] glucosamine N-acyltransferase
VIGPKAVILERSLIGARVEIRAGAVLGSEGFQTSRLGEEWAELAHAGGILIGDEVQIFANSVIARAVFRQHTTLERGVRVGNLAFVSHNVQAGRHCFIGHGAIINGCVIVGEEAWIGPGAVVSNSLTIGARAEVTLGSAVIRDVAPGERVTGNIATDHGRYLRHIASL